MENVYLLKRILGSGFCCPHCDEVVYFCHVPECSGLAAWEGWHGSELIRKIRVCEEHKNLLRGFQKKDKVKDGQ